MQIDNEFTVAAPLDRVWQYMLDVPRMAPCLPGAELTDNLGNGKYRGKVTTKMGPLSLSFAGEAQIVESNEAAKRVKIHASGSESRGGGHATMDAVITMQAAGGGTQVKASQNLNLSGKVAQYGRGMIQDVTTQLMRRFADCVSDNLARSSRGQAERAAKPAQGLTLAIQALVAAIKRLFGGKG